MAVEKGKRPRTSGSIKATSVQTKDQKSSKSVLSSNHHEYSSDVTERESFSKVMKALQDATGFEDYKAYCQWLETDPLYVGCSYLGVLPPLNMQRQSADDDISRAVVLDLTQVDGIKASVKVSYEGSSAFEVSETLADPSPGTRVQIVFLTIESGSEVSNNVNEFVNILGLGYRLDPSFFEPLILEAMGLGSSKLGGFRKGTFDGESDFHRSSSALVLKSIPITVTIASNYALARRYSPPVILIIDTLRYPTDEDRLAYIESEARMKILYDSEAQSSSAVDRIDGTKS